ncbi:FGGY-family carbohydrate kinase [soil metagenome]
MPSSIPVTAIFDIGKTNKKFLLFDDQHSIVHKRQKTLKETTDGDGFPCENLQELTRWIIDEFEQASDQKKYEITGLNFSTYGASLVHVDRNGEPVTPLYNYLKPCPEDLKDEFYQKYGGKSAFSLETASPPMGMLNSGLQLYWLKHRRQELFQKIETTLHLPQYISYLFTRSKYADLTSLGCHTGMWNFQNQTYHSWLNKEDVSHLLPPVKSVHFTQQIKSVKKSIKTGVGIHDSSAALAPYLLALEEPFIQLSTGTWSIAMNPFTESPLTFEEIKRDCLHYLNMYGKPVKASRLLLGAEYSHQVKKMGTHFDKDPRHLDCEADPELLEKLAKESDSSQKLILEKAHATGPYPHKQAGIWNVAKFKSYKKAAHQCMLDLASIQTDALGLSEGTSNINQVIITGGFAKNDFFCRLLATMLPDKKIFTTTTPYASGLGASLVLKMDSLKPDNIKKILGMTLKKPFPGLRINHYSWAKKPVKTD